MVLVSSGHFSKFSCFIQFLVQNYNCTHLKLILNANLHGPLYILRPTILSR